MVITVSRGSQFAALEKIWSKAKGKAVKYLRSVIVVVVLVAISTTLISLSVKGYVVRPPIGWTVIPVGVVVAAWYGVKRLMRSRK